jgi:glycosidase
MYNERLFGRFADPNGDGRFEDGVDGFRLDHTMDELDGNPRLGDLFAHFWAPLIRNLKTVNPRLTFVAEQADWASFGFEYFSQATVDRVFAFRLAMAIGSFDKTALTSAADTTLGMLPPGKEQVVFIENHDMDRFASRVNQDPGKERIGAVLNLLLGGIPAIYYGQELGMTGVAGHGNTDANDIPRRTAFEWYAADTGKGTAFWYGANVNNKAGDGISLEAERQDPGSLWNWYRSLLALRAAHPALSGGRYAVVTNTDKNVFSFCRVPSKGKRAWVVVNLSGTSATAEVSGLRGRLIFGNATGTLPAVTLPPYGVGVWESK